MMKNLVKSIILLLLISLNSCEKETFENKSYEAQKDVDLLVLPAAPFSSKKYTVNELPRDIKTFYYQVKNYNPNESVQKVSNTTGAIFAENSIVGNTDQKSNSNYSVGYFLEDTPKNIIYNLVINKDSTGTIVAKRYKYICNPSDYENFKSHNFDFKYFVGVTEVSSISSNSNAKAAFKTTTIVPPCVDAQPCIRTLPSAPSGSLGGNSSSNGTGFNTTVLGYNTSAGTGNYSATFGGTTYYSGGGASGGGANTVDNCSSHGYCIPDGYGGYHYSCGDLIPAHNHNKIKNNNKKTTIDPCDPCANNPLPTGYVPINLVPYYLQSIKAVIPFTKSQSVFLANNDAVVHQLWYSIDFSPAVLTDEYKQFILKAVQFKIDRPTFNLDDLFYNRSSIDIDSGKESDDYTIGGYDTNSYSNFNPQQTWPNIMPVIPINQFVGWGAVGINRNCMDYAKAQISKIGYQISSYYTAGQTFQVYTEQNGVHQTNLSNGLSYLKYALSNNIPVIVGVDDNSGNPGNLDGTTDHFIVIVGMGSNSNGKYFQFYDNASGNPLQGASPLNKLYYNSNTGVISGSSQCLSYFSTVSHNYIITQIRKSKIK